MKLLNKLEQINEDIEGINKTISNLLSEQTANPLINWWLRRKIRKSLTPDLNNDDSFSNA
jgi:regulator of replication initiation timing